MKTQKKTKARKKVASTKTVRKASPKSMTSKRACRKIALTQASEKKRAPPKSMASKKLSGIVGKYVYRVEWSEEDGEYVGLCAEFPSLSWMDEQAERSFKGIRKLVHDCVKDMKKNKEPIPEPLSMREFSGKFVVRVHPELHQKLATSAQEANISLNRLVSAKLSK